MSREGWGDPEDSPYDAAIEAGWLDPKDISKAVVDVMNERDRQWNIEGWTPEHDDKHDPGELAGAGAAYALNAACVLHPFNGTPLDEPPPSWLFEPEWWKPKTPRIDLVRAAALIIAEIEKLDRAGYDAERYCHGHIASSRDPKVCGRCGIHIDSLRPDDEEDPR